MSQIFCHEIFFWRKKYFEPPTSTFQAIIILLKFYFREKISFITNLQFQQHFIFILTFFLACRDNVTPKFYYKIRKKEDTIFHCFSSFYIVIKHVSFKEWIARFFFFKSILCILQTKLKINAININIHPR